MEYVGAHCSILLLLADDVTIECKDLDENCSTYVAMSMCFIDSIKIKCLLSCGACKVTGKIFEQSILITSNNKNLYACRRNYQVFVKIALKFDKVVSQKVQNNLDHFVGLIFFHWRLSFMGNPVISSLKDAFKVYVKNMWFVVNQEIYTS